MKKGMSKGGMGGGSTGNKSVMSPYSHSKVLGRKSGSMIGGSGKKPANGPAKAKKPMLT